MDSPALGSTGAAGGASNCRPPGAAGGGAGLVAGGCCGEAGFCCDGAGGDAAAGCCPPAPWAAAAPEVAPAGAAVELAGAGAAGGALWAGAGLVVLDGGFWAAGVGGFCKARACGVSKKSPAAITSHASAPPPSFLLTAPADTRNLIPPAMNSNFDWARLPGRRKHSQIRDDWRWPARRWSRSFESPVTARCDSQQNCSDAPPGMRVVTHSKPPMQRTSGKWYHASGPNVEIRSRRVLMRLASRTDGPLRCSLRC